MEEIPPNSLFKPVKIASEAYGSLHNAIIYMIKAWILFHKINFGQSWKTPKGYADYFDLIIGTFRGEDFRPAISLFNALYREIHIKGYYKANTSVGSAKANIQDNKNEVNSRMVALEPDNLQNQKKVAKNNKLAVAGALAVALTSVLYLLAKKGETL